MPITRAMKRIIALPALAPARLGFGRLLSRGHWKAWAKLHNGLRLRVDLSNTIGRSIRMRGSYEPVVEHAIVSRLGPGDCFVDVGSNVGYFSLIASQVVGTSGKVVAVEPVAEVACLLRETIAANSISNISVHQCAVSDHAGSAIMQVQRSSGVSFLGDRDHRLPGDAVRQEETVSVSTLDELVQSHGSSPLRVVKIDVEGREIAVLKGARETLRNARPTLVIEVSEQNLRRFGGSRLELDRLLLELDYRQESLSEPTAYDQVWVPR